MPRGDAALRRSIVDPGRVRIEVAGGAAQVQAGRLRTGKEGPQHQGMDKPQHGDVRMFGEHIA